MEVFGLVPTIYKKQMRFFCPGLLMTLKRLPAGVVTGMHCIVLIATVSKKGVECLSSSWLYVPKP